jgi:hypothetical protein
MTVKKPDLNHFRERMHKNGNDPKKAKPSINKFDGDRFDFPIWVRIY